MNILFAVALLAPVAGYAQMSNIVQQADQSIVPEDFRMLEESSAALSAEDPNTSRRLLQVQALEKGGATRGPAIDAATRERELTTLRQAEQELQPTQPELAAKLRAFGDRLQARGTP